MKLNLGDCHCRHIFFGCSHDNGYARLLEDIGGVRLINSITLLEGVPFERELASLKSKYATTRFDGLFREKKIVINPQHQSPGFSYVNGAPPGLPPPSHAPTSYSMAAPTASPPSPENGVSLNPPLTSWATTALNASKLAQSSPPATPQTTPAVPQIQRNRYGQRIDPVLVVDMKEVARIKKLKMCNVHFLKHECPWDPCTHDHHCNPTKDELQILKYVSRMTPCKYGVECDELKCIYGHRCPNDIEGKKDCRFGENCRFDRDMHGIDRTPVRTLRVGGK